MKKEGEGRRRMKKEGEGRRRMKKEGEEEEGGRFNENELERRKKWSSQSSIFL